MKALVTRGLMLVLVLAAIGGCSTTTRGDYLSSSIDDAKGHTSAL